MSSVVPVVAVTRAMIGAGMTPQTRALSERMRCSRLLRLPQLVGMSDMSWLLPRLRVTREVQALP